MCTITPITAIAPAMQAAPAARLPLDERPYVLFDFDGTLADTKAGIVSTARATLRAFGLTDEQIGDAGRLVGPAFPAAFTKLYGLSPADAQAVTESYLARYDTLDASGYPLYPGIRKLLEQLAASGRRLAIVTSKNEPLACRMARELGIDGLFEAIVGQGKDDGAHAGKAGLVARALRELGARPDETVMVGDRFYDVEGAAANGVDCVGVNFGTAGRAELERAGAACVVDTVGELAGKLLGRRMRLAA